MIQILLISHANFASGMLSAAQMIAGEQEGVRIVSLTEEYGFDSFLERVEKEIYSLDGEDGILVLIDLFGGTPGNITALVKKRNPELVCRGITGANLAMLIEALDGRTYLSLDELAAHCVETGIEAVKDIEVLL